MGFWDKIINIFRRHPTPPAPTPPSPSDDGSFAGDIKSRMRQLINVFETGTASTNYSSIYVYNDGPNKKRQITLAFGITEYGNLHSLIEKYIAVKGYYAEQFKPYLSKIGTSSLVDNFDFRNLLTRSTTDKVMRNCEDEIYNQMYWGRALSWFQQNGFTMNLSMMVILDSFVHSGSILSFLRNRFAEAVPQKGGDERNWIKQYILVRDQWLATHSNPILRKTVYRTHFLLHEIVIDNWRFSCPLSTQGVTICS